MSTLFLGLIFGSIGMGFAIYGKRQSAFVPLLCGIALIALPYVVGKLALLIILGIALVVLPFFLRF